MNVCNFLRSIADQRELFQFREFFIDQLFMNEDRNLFVRFCHLYCKLSDRFYRRNLLDFFKNRIRVDDDIRFTLNNLLLNKHHYIEKKKEKSK